MATSRWYPVDPNIEKLIESLLNVKCSGRFPDESYGWYQHHEHYCVPKA